MGTLENAQPVGDLPTIIYIPNYLTQDEEQQIITKVHSTKAKWTQLSGRKLQNHGGTVHEKGLIPAPIPDWLQSVVNRLCADTACIGLYGDGQPNHVLVNAYQPGEGIMPHEDGPAYHPGVCILSLGAPAIIRFCRKRRPEAETDESQQGAGTATQQLPCCWHLAACWCSGTRRTRAACMA